MRDIYAAIFRSGNSVLHRLPCSLSATLTSSLRRLLSRKLLVYSRSGLSRINSNRSQMRQVDGIQLLVVSILEQREPEEVRMKRLFAVFVLAASTVCLAQTDTSAKDDTKSKNDAKYSTDQTAGKTSDRAESAAAVLQEIFAAPDKGVPEDLLGSAKCAIVIPGMKKAGFVVGGRYGRGFATCRTANGWSAPAPVFLGGGSWGAQIGGEAVDVLMLVMNDKGMQQLLSSKFKIGVDASAAAGPIGRSASADTNWKLNSEILTYTRAKGLF